MTQSLEEALETLDARLCEEVGIQLEQVGLEEVAIDLRIQVRFVAHQLGEPFEALFPIRGKDGVLGQTVPDLFCLRIASGCGHVIFENKFNNYKETVSEGYSAKVQGWGAVPDLFSLRIAAGCNHIIFEK